MPHFENPPSQPAIDITEQLVMLPGERLSAIMARAKSLQRDAGCTVQFSFNGQLFTINPEPAADDGISSGDTRSQPKGEV